MQLCTFERPQNESVFVWGGCFANHTTDKVDKEVRKLERYHQYFIDVVMSGKGWYNRVSVCLGSRQMLKYEVSQEGLRGFCGRGECKRIIADELEMRHAVGKSWLSLMKLNLYASPIPFHHQRKVSKLCRKDIMPYYVGLYPCRSGENFMDDVKSVTA